MANDADPSWDEAFAAFGALEPSTVVRPPCTVTVDIAPDGELWAATSPDVTPFRLYSSSKGGAKSLARTELGRWIGDHVTLKFREATT